MSLTIIDQNHSVTKLERAQELHERIINAATDLVTLLAEMYKDDLYAQLGYDSWLDYLRELGNTVDLSYQYLYRLSNAGTFLLESGLAPDTLRESAVRPILEVLSDRKGFTQDDRRRALDIALGMGGESVTAKQAASAAGYVKLSLENPFLSERIDMGELSIPDALEIHDAMSMVPDDYEHGDLLVSILGHTSDSAVAKLFIRVARAHPDLWNEIAPEIANTGHISTADGRQIEIGKLDTNTLTNYLNSLLSEHGHRLSYRDMYYQVATLVNELNEEIGDTVANPRWRKLVRMANGEFEFEEREVNR